MSIWTLRVCQYTLSLIGRDGIYLLYFYCSTIATRVLQMICLVSGWWGSQVSIELWTTSTYKLNVIIIILWLITMKLLQSNCRHRILSLPSPADHTIIVVIIIHHTQCTMLTEFAFVWNLICWNKTGNWVEWNSILSLFLPLKNYTDCVSSGYVAFCLAGCLSLHHLFLLCMPWQQALCFAYFSSCAKKKRCMVFKRIPELDAISIKIRAIN